MKWEIRYHVRLWKAWVQFCCKACQCTKGEVSENHGIWKAAFWNAVMYPEGYSMLQDDVFQNSKGVLWRNSRYFEVKEEEEGSCTVWDTKRTRIRGAKKKKKKRFARGANLFLLLHPHAQELRLLSSGAREMPAHMACTGAVTQHCMLYRQDHTQIQQHTAMAHEVNASTALLQPSNCATSLSSSIPLWHPTSPLLAHGLKLQRIVMRVTVFLKILIGLSRQSPNKILWRVTATGQRTNGEGTLTTLLHICFPNLIS